MAYSRSPKTLARSLFFLLLIAFSPMFGRANSAAPVGFHDHLQPDVHGAHVRIQLSSAYFRALGLDRQRGVIRQKVGGDSILLVGKSRTEYGPTVIDECLEPGVYRYGYERVECRVASFEVVVSLAEAGDARCHVDDPEVGTPYRGTLPWEDPSVIACPEDAPRAERHGCGACF